MVTKKKSSDKKKKKVKADAEWEKLSPRRKALANEGMLDGW